MKQFYEELELEIVSFEAMDVITLSGGDYDYGGDDEATV